MSAVAYQADAQRIMEHIRHLAVTIGGRGSCTPNERQAAEYTVERMQAMGIANAHLETYSGAPSTYRPYALAFTAALLGTLLSWVGEGRLWLFLAACLNGLGAWGMLMESDCSSNWMRRFVPRRASHNALGVIPAAIQVRHRLVISAHLDTHRTPVFFSSPAWRQSFSMLVGLAFLSMAAAGGFFALGTLLMADWVRWLGLVAAALQIAAITLCLHADRTPFSPGANDNASGVGTVLEIAGRLIQQPLPLTEVWVVFTGCEETGASGMAAFLDSHAKALGEDIFLIVLDEAGLGELQYLAADGLVIRHQTHPRALDLARRASAALPGLRIAAHQGIAYTDALVATQRGLAALSVGCLPEAQAGQVSHWHQPSDTIQNIDPRALASSFAFTWQLVREVDKM
jgi:hypothetical protein